MPHRVHHVALFALVCACASAEKDGGAPAHQAKTADEKPQAGDAPAVEAQVEPEPEKLKAEPSPAPPATPRAAPSRKPGRDDANTGSPAKNLDGTLTDELGGELAELARLEKRLAATGVSVSALAGLDEASLAPADQAPAEGPARCEQICNLTEAICDIEGRICKLGDTHPNDRRYTDACTRATDDCKAGTDACTACSK